MFIIEGLKDLWNLLARCDEVEDLRRAGRSLRPRTLLNQLKAAFVVGLGSIIAGLLIGRFGYTVKHLDGLAAIGVGIREIGRIIRVLGVTYTAFWLVVIMVKGAFIVGALELIVSEETAWRIKHRFISLFVSVLSFGLMTLFDVVIPMDSSIVASLMAIVAFTVLYVLGVHNGKNYLYLAWGFNILVLISAFGSMFLRSDAFADFRDEYLGENFSVAAWLRTDAGRKQHTNEVIARVMLGKEEKSDRAYLGASNDEVRIAKSLRPLVVDECDERVVNAHLNRARAMLENNLNLPPIPDCPAERRANAAALAEKRVQEATQKRQQAATDAELKRQLSALEAENRAKAKEEKRILAERKAMVKRVLAGTVTDDDIEALTGVYPDIVELKRLRAKTTVSDCERQRLLILKARVAHFETSGETDFRQTDGIVVADHQLSLPDCGHVAGNPFTALRKQQHPEGDTTTQGPDW